MLVTLLNLDEPWAILIRLHVLRKNKVIKHHIFSSIWFSVKNETLIIRDNSTWILRNGRYINFWYDTWCDIPLILEIGETMVDEYLPVISLIIDHYWNFSNCYHDILDFLQVRIRNCHIPFDLQPDKRIQKNSLSGVITLKSTCEFKRNLGACKDWWHWV